MSFTPQDFRRSLGTFASGITVVTTVNPATGQYHGITVNSFTSVSLDPPLVLICIDKRTQAHQLLQDSGVFCANILSEAQQPLSDRFAGRMPELHDVFEDIPLHLETTGSPVFENTLGFVDCRIVQAVDGGDHTIYIGQVERLGYDENSNAAPLLYYKSVYRNIAE